jgi:predicted amidohydrolase YtcJ
LLTRWDLDIVSPKNPVYLHHYTCHSTVLNSEGLKASKITKNTKDPIGGWILRDESGEPTGFLRSNARFIPPVGLNGVRPRPSKEEHRKAVIKGAQRAVTYGLTSIHIPSADLTDVEICCDLASRGELPLRVNLMLKVELYDRLSEIKIPNEIGDFVKLNTIKVFSDGSLIAHTAALKEPFNGETDNLGLLGDKKLFTSQIIEAHRAGLQLAVHATGDRAVEAVLDAFQEAQTKYPRTDCRHRIEHGSLMNGELRRRSKALGVIVSTQPELLTKYGDRFKKSLGPERLSNAYALRSLIDDGVIVSGGSDCPLTFCRPLNGIEAAVTRISEITGEVISPEQRLTLDEAVRMYTINAAYAGFSESLNGTIKAGNYADLTVLDRDPWNVNPSELSKIKVEMTIVGGKIVYRRKS